MSPKLSWCPCANDAWLLIASVLTPTMSAPTASNCARASRKASASRVQPGVSSRG
ncbi:MAG: hypothetical protein U0325_04690 [Polyangiales bacterium]